MECHMFWIIAFCQQLSKIDKWLKWHTIFAFSGTKAMFLSFSCSSSLGTLQVEGILLPQMLWCGTSTFANATFYEQIRQGRVCIGERSSTQVDCYFCGCDKYIVIFITSITLFIFLLNNLRKAAKALNVKFSKSMENADEPSWFILYMNSTMACLLWSIAPMICQPWSYTYGTYHLEQ